MAKTTFDLLKQGSRVQYYYNRPMRSIVVKVTKEIDNQEYTSMKLISEDALLKAKSEDELIGSVVREMITGVKQNSEKPIPTWP